MLQNGNLRKNIQSTQDSIDKLEQKYELTNGNKDIAESEHNDEIEKRVTILFEDLDEKKKDYSRMFNEIKKIPGYGNFMARYARGLIK
jgi:hypothetical protein